MRSKLVRAAFVCLTACIGVTRAASAGDVALPEGIWQGTYKCGQDRLHLAGAPFEWSMPFTIQDGRISAIREYISVSSQPAIAEFNGLIQDDGTVEIAVNGGFPIKLHPAFHGTYTTRVKGDRLDFQGPMMGKRNVVLRQCELHLKPDPQTEQQRPADPAAGKID